MEQKLVSVIIPVYNAEKYLQQCLNSVLNQTWPYLQVICVDDGSTDNSWVILNQYAQNDKRLVILRKANESVSTARNLALEFVEGEYIAFVDSDDWLDLDAIESAIRTLDEQDADVVMWSYTRELAGNSFQKKIFTEDTVFSEKVVKEQLYRRLIGLYGEELRNPESMDVLGPVWMKLYRRNIISDNNIRFYDIRKIGTYEDGIFNLEYFAHVKKAVFIEKCFYHWRRDNIESVTSVYKEKLPEQWDNLYNVLQKHIEDNQLDDMFTRALSNRIALSILFLGINEMESKDSYRNRIKRIRTLLSQPKYVMALKKLDLSFFPIHWKLFFLCAKWKCSIGVVCLLTIIQKIRGK